jgi:hypothetical protein
MPDTEKTETITAAPEEDHPTEVRHPSTSRRAAAVEAAYILEAVRK